MKKILLDIPQNILIIAAGVGIYNQPTLEELVRDNSSFWFEDDNLYTESNLDIFLIAGTVDGQDYIKLFSEE